MSTNYYGTVDDVKYELASSEIERAVKDKYFEENERSNQILSISLRDAIENEDKIFTLSPILVSVSQYDAIEGTPITKALLTSITYDITSKEIVVGDFVEKISKSIV